LSINSWSEPALATLARVGVPVRLGEGVDAALGLTAGLLDPQPSTTNAASAVRATADLDRQTRMNATSVRAISVPRSVAATLMIVPKSSIGFLVAFTRESCIVAYA
jgi:hypothetical protein